MALVLALRTSRSAEQQELDESLKRADAAKEHIATIKMMNGGGLSGFTRGLRDIALMVFDRFKVR